MKRYQLWAILALVVVLAGAGGWALWNYELRWRPKTIAKHQDEITRILESSGWVSPGKTGPTLYMVSFRACPDCLRFSTEVFPPLQAANVDTRVIEIARADLNGVPKSTPAERSTVAELWLNRSWPLMERWEQVPAETWTAPGVVPADGDMARTAVVEAGRKMAADLKPLLKANGIDFAYPTLIWWTADGKMRGCVCDRPETYRFVLKELGAEG